MGCTYMPFDLIPRQPNVIECDITKKTLPQVDLILCRHVLNHLSVSKARDAIYNFLLSTSRYLLMTNCDNQREYWRHYKFDVDAQLVETFEDCQHWQLELYEL